MYKLISLFAFAFALILFQVSCGESVKNPTKESQGVVRSVRMYEERARAQAREWAVDSFLIQVHVNPLNQDVTPVGPTADLLSFQFVSPSHTAEMLVVTFKLDGMVQLYKGHLARSPNEFVPIQSSDWVLDSTDAWQKAQQAIQGTPAESNFRRASMELARWNPPRMGQVLWYINYTGAVPGSDARILIDAMTGELVDKQ